jgi:hypothetical protein
MLKKPLCPQRAALLLVRDAEENDVALGLAVSHDFEQPFELA